MARSRKARRKLERQRAKGKRQSRSLSPTTRLAWIGGGVVLVTAGIILLLHSTAQAEARIARLAGILIVVGFVFLAIGAFGSA